MDLDDLRFAVFSDDLGPRAITKGGFFSPRGWRLIDIATKKKTNWFRVVDATAFDAYGNLIRTSSRIS